MTYDDLIAFDGKRVRIVAEVGRKVKLHPRWLLHLRIWLYVRTHWKPLLFGVRSQVKATGVLAVHRVDVEPLPPGVRRLVIEFVEVDGRVLSTCSSVKSVELAP